MEQIDTTLIASFKLLIQILFLFLDTIRVQFLALRYQHFLYLKLFILTMILYEKLNTNGFFYFVEFLRRNIYFRIVADRKCHF